MWTLEAIAPDGGLDAPGVGPPPRRPHVVVGLGRTGLSCVRHLRARGLPVAAVDTREAPPELETLRREFSDVPVRLGALDPALLAAAERVVLSPGVSLAERAVRAAVASGVEVVGDIELFAELAEAPVVAITGSNGKSTVTSMVAAMAAAAGHQVGVGGNLGPPALGVLNPLATLYVLELSSFQLETTHSLAPAAAAVLNVSADHMDRYADVEEYAAAKRRILERAAWAVLNADDCRVLAMARVGQRCSRFTLGEPEEGEFGIRRHGGMAWLAHGPVSLMPVRDLRVPGRHNVANALAALALGTAVELSQGAMLQALRAFEGLPHRCRLVAEVGGVRWFNDSKATNVGATVAAMAGLGESSRLVLIMGGDGKGADFAPLRDSVARYARAVVLLGRDAPLIDRAIRDAAPIERAAGLDDAVARARALARPGDCVLFAPACASFDMFASFEARGFAFEQAVARELRG